MKVLLAMNFIDGEDRYWIKIIFLVDYPVREFRKELGVY